MAQFLPGKSLLAPGRNCAAPRTCSTLIIAEYAGSLAFPNDLRDATQAFESYNLQFDGLWVQLNIR